MNRRFVGYERRNWDEEGIWTYKEGAQPITNIEDLPGKPGEEIHA